MPYAGPYQNPSSASAPMSVSGQPPQHLPSRSQNRPRPSLSQSDTPLPFENMTAATQQQQQALSQQQQHERMLQHQALVQQQMQQQQMHQQQMMQQQQQQMRQEMQQMQEQNFYGSEMSRSQMDDSISPKSEPKEFCLVAEAARRAEMAILLRDMAEVAL